MKAFLTGATGFIGSRLARRLIGDGHDVAVLVRENSDRTQLAGIVDRISFHLYDGTQGALAASLAAERPDVVVHLAALALTRHEPDEVGGLIASNIDMPSKLLEAMRMAGTTRFINTGTFWQHYRSARYDPVNLYAATKQAFEDIIAYYVEVHGMKSVTLKLFDTYGPNDPRPKLFTLLRRVAATGESLRMTPGEQLVDLVYIDDVLDAYIAAINLVDQIEGTATFAVSNPERHTLRHIVGVYGEVIGHALAIEWGGLPYRPRDTLVPWTGGRRLDGWTPRISLEEGIRRMERAAGTLA